MNKTFDQTKSDQRPVRRTEAKEVRRSQLIDATIASIAKHGIRGTTMSTVTETAGLSLGIVNFHFKSKQNLFEETLVFLAREHHDEWTKAYAAAGDDPKAQLLAIVDSHFTRRVCSRKKLAVWFAFYGEAARRVVYRSLIDDMDDDRFDRSKELCSKLAADSDQPTMPPEIAAKTLEGLYDGLLLNILMYPTLFDRHEAKKQVHAYLASVFPKHFDMPEF
ncbi:MAG: TetR family transcriptional regulator C-terminal domain-containing protein [Pseudomonadota bacterium]